MLFAAVLLWHDRPDVVGAEGPVAWFALPVLSILLAVIAEAKAQYLSRSRVGKAATSRPCKNVFRVSAAAIVFAAVMQAGLYFLYTGTIDGEQAGAALKTAGIIAALAGVVVPFMKRKKAREGQPSHPA